MTNTPDILKKIIARKQQEIAQCIKTMPLTELIEQSKNASKTRGFYQALKTKIDAKQNAVIAEIKKASPSKGVLRKDFNPVEIAKSYELGDATCLSILTDKDFFQGDNQYLIDARAAVSLPILRKEFIIDAYQVYEARTMGSDCILLIAACLTDAQMNELSSLAISLNMDVLIEVHNLKELKRTLKLNLPMIGINNRNLRTFDVSLQTTIDLLEEIKEDTLVITESGILNAEDVTLMNTNNIYGYLVGEAFMRQPNPGQALQEIFA
ncbi:indole-3-glycerol phosphate synthase [Abyssogena phaseoliformis symbiont OG214]|uniref:indole-3-glycerol phosphate synthase TrpC n=1 Tax=Abyssogena phaseoliformis symbiont TaxID=596095 RepID=UPI0019167556|nr:indole-3-glycerol phosphate synthase TrpC [Abyssogena phaseoliformis symbiont]MBW5289673.1 Indole-3-glycerol phosphate synthase [Candidatus Ruthia sp. Apha_13_S6]BBB22964.1 indole-3-glycerol phosphate synthase [Abyssogena phaseoliformis symbiont OG214]